VLATNTSSISVTAIANGLQHPGRLVGMHFFNPVPLMKLVEVVSGLQTDAEVAEAIFARAKAWGKVPVHARSTPGFIVNRIARPYYAETLALLLEQAATPPVLDACLRAAGFRMGPCELMDLIGHDTNFAVTQSVYEANFFDKRFVPSLVQREMVDGGLLGRKSGAASYRYADVAHSLHEAGRTYTRNTGADWVGLSVDGAHLRQTDGRAATLLTNPDTVVFDWPLSTETGAVLAVAPSLRASDAWAKQAQVWMRALGWTPVPVADAPGLVVARTVAMLINEASDAVHQGVCTADGADAAMKLGVNYPVGPFEWLGKMGAPTVAQLLDALDAHYRGERYRVSPWLRMRVMAHGS
jgi:3-hydroxybutyryl-CoA dehydrogenase